MNILITGGAGYIGSHMVRLLQKHGHNPTIVDDLSTGSEDRTISTKFFNLDLSSNIASKTLQKIFTEEKIEAVIHFAAKKQVGESVTRHLWYYEQNIQAMHNILEAMGAAKLNKLIFSSSAATYGMAGSETIKESDPTNPINPYGQTKLICEWMIKNSSTVSDLRAVSLRYFNVAGVGWKDLEDPGTYNLIPIILNNIEKNKTSTIYGDNYNTPDGTCIRDYIHISDLVEAHLEALKYLEKETREHSVFNVGTGSGNSVREILDCISSQSGINFPITVVERRDGDPPQLVANVERINKILNWQASRNLYDIVDSALSVKKF